MTDAGSLLADKYRLGHVIGTGGMGGVYEATHEQIGKKVAVKLLKPELAFDGDMVVRFMREARVAAAIGHPGIVDVYDVGATPDGALFLVMELLRGETLEQLLGRTPALDLPTATYAACQVLSALEAAHRQDVVHRDIKPANVFLCYRGQALPDVKLLDFGVSKVFDPSRPGGRLTKTGIPVGTPSYMAPEQVLGEKDVDLRVDVYATGVLLYQSLTGQKPFVGDDTEGVFHKIVQGHFTPPSRLRADIPPGFEHVILTAMSHRRELRYPSATKMLASLLPFLDERVADRIVLPEGLERRSSAPSLRPAPPFGAAGGVVPGSGPYPAAPAASPFPPGPGSGPHGLDRTSGTFPVGRGSGPYPTGGPPPGPSGADGSHRILAAAVALGLVALVALGATFAIVRPWEMARADREPPAVETPAQPSPPEEPAAAPPPPASQPAPGAIATNTVRITIEAHPSEAVLSVDGNPLSGNPFVGRFPRDGREHLLAATAEGHERRERRILFDRDQAISIQLAPAEGRRRPRRNREQLQPRRTSGGRGGALPPPAPWATNEPGRSGPAPRPRSGNLADNPF